MIDIDGLVVAVPARDEASTIARCLDSILTALDHPEAKHCDATVIVAADGCTDRTEAIVRSTRRRDDRVRLVRGEWCSAGAARAAATDAGLRAIDEQGDRRATTWIATTDADSTVPHDWLAQQLHLAGEGWVGVAGVVRLSGDETASVHDHFIRTYEVPAHGRHPHVHGANLGVRADALDSVGGWVPVALAEDHATWRRLLAADFPVISSTASWVWTSGRTAGRAAGGFADTLAGLERGA